MDTQPIPVQDIDYTPFISGSYAIFALVLVWLIIRTLVIYRKEKRLLEKINPS